MPKLPAGSGLLHEVKQDGYGSPARTEASAAIEVRDEVRDEGTYFGEFDEAFPIRPCGHHYAHSDKNQCESLNDAGAISFRV